MTIDEKQTLIEFYIDSKTLSENTKQLLIENLLLNH